MASEQSLRFVCFVFVVFLFLFLFVLPVRSRCVARFLFFPYVERKRDVWRGVFEVCGWSRGRQAGHEPLQHPNSAAVTAATSSNDSEHCLGQPPHRQTTTWGSDVSSPMLSCHIVNTSNQRTDRPATTTHCELVADVVLADVA